METRRRGHSFYEDEENEEVIQVRVKSASPSPERSSPKLTEEIKDTNDTESLSLSSSGESPFGNTDPYADLAFSLDSVKDEEEEEQQPRGRARSRSMCKHTVDPSTLQVSSSNTDGGHLGDSPNAGDSSSTGHGIGGADGSDSKRSKSAERVGPLTQHEVQVLKKGLEDATKIRNRNELQEEEEERRAAKAEEEERLVMAGKHGPGKSGEEKSSPGGITPSSMRSFFSRDKGSSKGADAASSQSAADVAETLVAARDGSTPSSSSSKAASPTVMQKYTLGSENNNMRRFKILLLGDSGVGKSSLILRWTEDRYLATLTGTVGVNFKSKKVNIDGEAVHIQVWDTAGQQQFHKITTSYYRGAHGIMVVYDVSDPESLANVEYWIKNIKTHATENVRVILVGNKTDLRAKWLAAEAAATQAPILSQKNDKDTNQSSHSSAAAAMAGPTQCSDYGAGREIAERFQVPYFETSALDATGTDEAFMNIARFCVGVEDGKASLLVPTNAQPAAGAAAKPSMISRMMGRGNVAPPKAAPVPPPRSRQGLGAFPPSAPSASNTSANVGDKASVGAPDKKKCTMQ